MTRAERLVSEFKACRGVFPYKDLVRQIREQLEDQGLL